MSIAYTWVSIAAAVVVWFTVWWLLERRYQRETNELLAEMQRIHREWERNRDPDFEPRALRTTPHLHRLRPTGGSSAPSA